MPLEHHEWDIVRCLVEEFLVGTADPYAELSLRFPDLVGGWSITTTPAKNAQFIVLKATDSRAGDPDPFSIRLLTALVGIHEIRLTRPTEHAALLRFLERLQAEQAASAADDPFDARILGSGEVFIDRLPTRDLLRRLTRPEPRKPVPLAIRVVGGERLGKSYTYSFIRHLSAFHDVAPVPVFLDSSYTAEDIVRDLSTKIGIEHSEPHEVPDRTKQIRHWADWLLARAVESTEDKAWWLVFDQCNKLDPSSDAVDLITHLAQNVKHLAVQGSVAKLAPKLVLLGYDDDLPDLDLGKQVIVDQVNRVRARELTDFFSAVFQQISEEERPGESVDKSKLAEDVEASVHRVLQDAEEAVESGQCFMEAVSLSASDVVDFYREEIGRVA